MRLVDADALTAWMIGELRAMPNGVFNNLNGRQAANLIGKAIDEAPTVGGWISVEDRLPEEKESMFAKFHATEKWSRAMWLKESETVLVGVAFPDGGKKVTVGKLRDGKWSTTVSQAIPHTVTHWRPLPEYPEEENDNEDAQS